MFLLDYPYCKGELSDVLQERKVSLMRQDSTAVLLFRSTVIGHFLFLLRPVN